MTQTIKHKHDMRLHGATIYRCSSCSFKCTADVVHMITVTPERHIFIKPSDPKAKEIWNG